MLNHPFNSPFQNHQQAFQSICYDQQMSDPTIMQKQAEEEKKAQEEAAKKAAADKAAAEKDDNPVAFLRNLMSTKTPVQVASAAKELEVEGGPAGRIRVLFEVCSADPAPLNGTTHRILKGLRSFCSILVKLCNQPVHGNSRLKPGCCIQQLKMFCPTVHNFLGMAGSANAQWEKAFLQSSCNHVSVSVHSQCACV